jgi:hypothetical protein
MSYYLPYATQPLPQYLEPKSRKRRRPFPSEEPPPSGTAGPSLGTTSASHGGSDQGQSDTPDSRQPQHTKRGKKPIEVPRSVEQGLVRLFNRTDTPFDHIAEAVRRSKAGLG